MAPDNEVLVRELFEALENQLGFTIEAGSIGLNRVLLEPEVQRPGLALAGFLDYFNSNIVQIIGQTELAYMATLTEDKLVSNWTQYLKQRPSLIIVSRGLSLPKILLDIANNLGVVILYSPHKTDLIIHKVELYLERELAPSVMLHGVLMDVFGLGVLIQGESGVGKSETALELLKRGHRLVSDDVVEIMKMRQDILRGKSPELTKHHIEIRGIGILNIHHLFGASSIVDEMDITMVAKMERWKEGFEYDRLGLSEEKSSILGIDVPSILIPVQPGRNIAVIVEVGVMNQRLKNMGFYAATEFSQRLDKILSGKGKIL